MKEKTTEKLTFFVSSKEFNVCAAAFKELLSRRGILQYYYKQWNTRNWAPFDMPVELVWEKWAKEKAVQDWIICAFSWSESGIPLPIWAALHKEWNEWLEDNLKI